MDEFWVAYLCLAVLVIILFLMNKKPDDEIEKEKKNGSNPAPTSTYSSSSGRHLECTEEELDASLERLSGLFSADVRKRELHHEHKASPHQREQEKTSHPGSHENLLNEIEQAVQEAVETDVYVKRRQPQTAPRSRREGQWSETSDKF